jgi:hypothetical protein
VIGTTALTQRYELALQALDVPVRSVGSEAAWRGLWTIAQTLGETEVVMPGPTRHP